MSQDGMNAMMVAVRYNRLDSIAALADAEVSVGAVPGKVQYLGTWAGHGGSHLSALVASYLAQGDIVQQNPLTLAAYLGHGDAVALLLARGAVDWMPDAAGDTALEVAMRRGHDDIADRLDPDVRTAMLMWW